MEHDGRLSKKTLLSLIPPSCMVVPNREIANSNIFTSTLAMSNPVESKAGSENVPMGAPRVL